MVGRAGSRVPPRMSHLEYRIRPRRVIYVPDWLRVVPWAELTFGWVIDRVGPLLLKKNKKERTHRSAFIITSSYLIATPTARTTTR